MKNILTIFKVFGCDYYVVFKIFLRMNNTYLLKKYLKYLCQDNEYLLYNKNYDIVSYCIKNKLFNSLYVYITFNKFLNLSALELYTIFNKLEVFNQYKILFHIINRIKNYSLLNEIKSLYLYNNNIKKYGYYITDKIINNYNLLKKSIKNNIIFNESYDEKYNNEHLLIYDSYNDKKSFKCYYTLLDDFFNNINNNNYKNINYFLQNQFMIEQCIILSLHYKNMAIFNYLEENYNVEIDNIIDRLQQQCFFDLKERLNIIRINEKIIEEEINLSNFISSSISKSIKKL